MSEHSGVVISDAEKTDAGQAEHEYKRNIHCLLLFLKRLEIDAEPLSDLAKQRDSFGLAWLKAFLFVKMLAQDEIYVEPPTRINLIGPSGVGVEKRFLFVNALPLTIKQVTLDSRTLGGRAFELLLEYLMGLMELQIAAALPGPAESKTAASSAAAAAKNRSGKLPQNDVQKREIPGMNVLFAENSLEPSETPEILELLLPLVEGISLKGNPIGTEGFRALAELVRAERAQGLRILNLQRTGLDSEGLELICEAIKDIKENKSKGHDGWGLECLNLSENRIGTEEMKMLCSVLSRSTLPRLGALHLAKCGLRCAQIDQLAGIMGKGGVRSLELLDLEGNEPLSGEKLGSVDLGGLGRALQNGQKALPHLKILNLFTDRCADSVEGMRVFLSAVESLKCPLLKDVNVHLGEDVSEDHLRRLCQRQNNCAVRGLRLRVEGPKLIQFLRAFMCAAEPPRFEIFDLVVGISTVNDDGTDIGTPSCIEVRALRMLGEAIRSGRLSSCLRTVALSLAGLNDSPRYSESRTNFFRALGTKVHPVSNLASLVLGDFGVSNEQMGLLGAAAKEGNLNALGLLNLSRNGKIGKAGMEAFVKGIEESEEGLPGLKRLSLSLTGAGAGAGFLGKACLAGKLPKLLSVDLSDSRLTAEGVRGLAVGVKGGGLSGVVELDLSERKERAPADKDEREALIAAWKELIESFAASEVGMPKLKVLDMSGTLALKEGGSVLAAFASGNLPSLERLQNKRPPRDSRSKCFEIGPVGMQSLIDAVHSQSFPRNLRGVNVRLSGLHGATAGADGNKLIIAIAESEKGLPPCISSLSFSGSLSSDALSLLAASGKRQCEDGGKLSNLETLILSDCQIDNQKLKLLAQCFSVHLSPELKVLDLRKNPFDRETLSAFIDTLRPESLQNLEKFLVDFTDEALESLEEYARSKGKLSFVDVSCFGD